MPTRVLLYLPFESPFYNGLYPQIKKGFEQAGCIVEGGCGYLDGDDLLRKIDSFRPDFVFEMNRSRSEIKGFPKGLRHVCWLVDYWGRRFETLDDADFLYLFSRTWLKLHQEFRGNHLDVLHPGTDPDLYYPVSRAAVDPSVIFLGHMTKPWLEPELDRSIPTLTGGTIKFKEMVPRIHAYISNPPKLANHTSLWDYFNINLDEINDSKLYYDLTTRLFREGRRLSTINKALFSKLEINFYGNQDWEYREPFKDRYKGMLLTPQDMNRAFNQHSAVLHDGNTPHFRVFDGIAAGLLVFKPDTQNDEWDGLNFEEGIDVISYRLDSPGLGEKKQLQTLFQKDLQQVRREKILTSHTWAHRACKIMQDLNASRQSHPSKES